MFEQELEKATPVEKTKEGDLFHKYEIRHWHHGPHSYKVLIASTLITFTTLLLIAQTDLLTRRGCDSPWVGSVCQVLDMAYVSTVMYGTPTDYVDQAYEDTELEDAEITFIDVSGAEPLFQYPADYDQYANPEKLAQQQAEQEALQNPTSAYSEPLPTYPPPSNNLAAQTPVLPKSNPNAVTGDIPDSPFSFSDSNSNTVASRKGRNGRLNPNKTSTNSNTDQSVAQNDSNTNTAVNPPLSSEQVLAVEINKRPMVDLGNTINEIREKGPLNLESEFTVTGKGKLDKAGKLDPKSFRFGPSSGKNEAVINVVKESVEAINEAGYLAYIKNAIDKDGKFVDLNFILTQNAENVEATIETSLANESLAKLRKSSFDLFLGVAKRARQSENASQNDKDDLTLLEGVQTEALGKILRIKFVIPKGMVHPMIQRKLAEQAAELKKPNGQANTRQNDNTAPK